MPIPVRSILKWPTDLRFCCKRRRFILTNQKRPFFAVTRPLVSGGVRTGTPAWSRGIARIAFRLVLQAGSNLQVPILSSSLLAALWNLRCYGRNMRPQRHRCPGGSKAMTQYGHQRLVSLFSTTSTSRTKCWSGGAAVRRRSVRQTTRCSAAERDSDGQVYGLSSRLIVILEETLA